MLRAFHQSRITVAYQSRHNRIIQDCGLVDELVRGPSNGYTQCSFAGPAMLHEYKFRGIEMEARRIP